MWRSVGFLMSFAVVMEGMTLIAFLVMITGGIQKRQTGWKILSGLLVISGLVQCAGMGLIVSSIYHSELGALWLLRISFEPLLITELTRH